MRRSLERLLERVGVLSDLGPTRTVAGERDGSGRRLLASVVVSLTGLVLLVPNLVVIRTGQQPPIGYGLAVFGALVSLGLAIAGYLLQRSDFSAINAVRIAVWNVLGIVVLGLIMTLLLVYQQALGGTVVAATFTAGNVLAIGAAAHVLIGFYDARRVRAEEVARDRKRIAVLNRVLRHNLRNEATVLLGHAEHLVDELDDPTLRQSAEVIRSHAETVGGLADEAGDVVDAFEASADVSPTDLATAAESATAAVADAFPEATVVSDVPADLSVLADAGLLETAIRQLVENGAEHATDEAVTVRVTATAESDRWVRLRVVDDGPGIPETERAVVTGDAEITQLVHGSGLGLWVVRAFVDATGGDLDIETNGGTVVTLRLPRARAEA